MSIDLTSISSIVIAIGALGTSSFGLVDATKVFGGGISLAGLGDIKEALLPLFGYPKGRADAATPFSYGFIYASVKASWINGVALADQKANAAALIKLSLKTSTAANLASATGVSREVLTELAVALNLGAVLTKEETDVLSRFEDALALILDQAYQRATQRYRNAAKALACVFSVLIAVFAGAICSSSSTHAAQFHGVSQPYWRTGNVWLAVLAGLLATPLAPIAKDITSALTAASALTQKRAAE